jgi:hypothetical protein
MKEKDAVQNTVTLDARREEVLVRKESFDTPFATFTWQQWMEAQEAVGRCLSTFLCAAQEGRADRVLMSGLELQEIANQMLLEAYVRIADLPLEELPAFKKKKEC